MCKRLEAVKNNEDEVTRPGGRNNLREANEEGEWVTMTDTFEGSQKRQTKGSHALKLTHQTRSREYLSLKESVQGELGAMPILHIQRPQRAFSFTCIPMTSHLTSPSLAVLGTFNYTREVEELHLGPAVPNNARNASERGELVIGSLGKERKHAIVTNMNKSNISRSRDKTLSD